MRIYIVIPAFNEAQFIGRTLESLTQQSLLPEKVVIVNDGSTDDTELIVTEFCRKHPFISLVQNDTEGGLHAPGSKVIKAFNEGYKHLDGDYDIICKFDSDLIFPQNYLERIAFHFNSSAKAGMVGGFCTIEKNGNWEIENLTGKDHIRGALKAYRKECFEDIGKLREAMGWDTVDELLAHYHDWQVVTDENLLVKHLKPTGASYSNRSGERQGLAFYRLRYGRILTYIASAKLAYQKKDLKLFREYIRGFHLAKKEKRPYLVSEDEGIFIRNLRWKKIFQKLF
ncbi:MAG TPA: glycosyltransferase family A protein [Gillisia sp.]|nr:glycosyltransferase family A protein [Gillisia sp.]